jgi:hypothetical protein
MCDYMRDEMKFVNSVGVGNCCVFYNAIQAQLYATIAKLIRLDAEGVFLRIASIVLCSQ